MKTTVAGWAIAALIAVAMPIYTHGASVAGSSRANQDPGPASAYISHYEKAHHDDSHVGIDNAAAAYVQAKHKANDALCEKLTPAQRKLIGQARQTLNDFCGNFFSLQIDLGGGGTIWDMLNNEAEAQNEQELGEIIESMMQHANSSSGDRATADRIFNACRRSVRKLDPGTNRDPSGSLPDEDAVKDFAKTRTALDAAGKIQQSLPDQAALLFAKQVSWIIASADLAGPGG